MQVVLFGEKTKWEAAIRFIMEKHPDVMILGLCDPTDKELAKTNDAVCTIDQMLKLYRDGFVEAVITVDASIPEWNEYLHREGINNYAIPTKYYHMKSAEWNGIDKVFFPYGEIPPELQHLEFHLADHCNLKCRGCTHFSNLVNGEVFADFTQYQKDIVRLAELFDNIKEIHLMGGEPLLNKDVEKFIRVSREAFPYSEIALVTNGLLLTTMKGSFFDAIRETDTMISISDYTCLDEEKILSYLADHGIRKCELRNGKQFFAKNLNLNADENVSEIFAQCPRRVCTCLGKGVIAACVQPFVTRYFNAYYGQNLSEEGAISLYTDGIDGYEIIRHLLQPMEVCRYCTYEESFEWEISKEPIPMSDWVVERT